MKTGRVADLDADCCVKMIVPVGNKRHAKPCHSIILPSTGVFLARVRRKERPRVPPDVMRLSRMWECALQGPMDFQEVDVDASDRAEAPSTLQDQCICCGLGEGSRGSRVFTCSFCLLSAHTECLSDVVAPHAFGHFDGFLKAHRESCSRVPNNGTHPGAPSAPSADGDHDGDDSPPFHLPVVFLQPSRQGGMGRGRVYFGFWLSKGVGCSSCAVVGRSTDGQIQSADDRHK